jgi:folate-binding Fe-S cluster repair protein YgfZ
VEWLRTAVHLQKGCYRGQETVARVHNLGRPPRRLVLLHLDGVSEELPEPGTPVQVGTREVGRTGSVVRHHDLGVIALALVKQSVAADAELTVGGSRAAIDPDDAPAALDADQAAARERVRAVRSATIQR